MVEHNYITFLNDSFGIIVSYLVVSFVIITNMKDFIQILQCITRIFHHLVIILSRGKDIYHNQ